MNYDIKVIDDYGTVNLCATCQNKFCYWYESIFSPKMTNCDRWEYTEEDDSDSDT